MTKQRKEGTQEFFNKKNADKQTYTFNKAPINKTTAKQEIISERAKPKKRSAFMANLYKDEDDIEDLKVLGGDEFEAEEDTRPVKARDSKATAKGKNQD
jgi:hypothetical protein